MQNTYHKIQCQCGHLQGRLSAAASVTRLSCHCKDCQAYAHALDNVERILDDNGGTEVVTTLQQHVSFTKGAEHLACLSLSDKGLLRWYASCCNTPIGNTARDPKMSFVALAHSCLGDSPAALDQQFGGQAVATNTKHARNEVPASTLDGLFATVRIVGSVIKARANGSWKNSPFFRPGTLKPAASPRVLNSDELSRAFKLGLADAR